MEKRQAIQNILDGNDHRLFLIVGPCSIHDAKPAREYAAKLAELAKKLMIACYLSCVCILRNLDFCGLERFH